MELDTFTSLTQQAFIVAAQIAGPVLLVALLVGLLFAVLQSVTQVQEQTLSVVPKIIAVGALLFAMLPWFLGVLTGYTRQIFEQIGGAP